MKNQIQTVEKYLNTTVIARLVSYAVVRIINVFIKVNKIHG